MIYDRDGNLIAEADAATGVTKREYIWLGSRPIAVVDDVDTSSPMLLAVHVDHLDRPVMMTDAVGAAVLRATYLPFGEVHSIDGPESLEARFPGQWFMAETGLAYNWHRWYAASLGRYTQPDPLGLVDGPNRYAYAKNSPLMYVDPTGLIHDKLGNLWDWIHPYRPDDPGSCPLPADEPEDCYSRFDREYSRCFARYDEYAHPDFLRGCLDRAADRRTLCIRNGLTPNPEEPDEWGDADEYIWRNFNR